MFHLFDWLIIPVLWRTRYLNTCELTSGNKCSTFEQLSRCLLIAESARVTCSFDHSNSVPSVFPKYENSHAGHENWWKTLDLRSLFNLSFIFVKNNFFVTELRQTKLTFWLVGRPNFLKHLFNKRSPFSPG